VATPLFIGRTLIDESGKTSFNLTLPDNLSAFEVYASATAGDQYFANASTTIISEKKVNMNTIIPNFVRINDDVTGLYILQDNSNSLTVELNGNVIITNKQIGQLIQIISK